jgi:hypothetical protein
MRDHKRLINSAEMLIPVLIAAGLGILMTGFRLDDSFISYRYARNIAQGLGFVYNAGQPVLSITNPLYTLLLAGGYLITPNLPALGNWLGTAAMGFGGWLMAGLAHADPSTRSSEVNREASLASALFYVCFPLVWLALGLETPLQLMLGLLAIWLYLRRRMAWAGLAVGLATLTRPDMAVLAGVLALDYLLTGLRFPPAAEEKRPIPPLRPLLTAGGVFAASLLPWGIWATFTFGSPLPATLGAKSAQAALGITGISVGTSFLGGLATLGRDLIAQSPLWAVAGLIGLIGLILLPRRRWAFPLVGWAIFHLAGYIALGVAPYRWYYAPLVPALAALFGLGLEWLTDHLRGNWRQAGIAAGLLTVGLAAGRSFYLIEQTPRHDTAFLEGHGPSMLPTVDWDIYRATGLWLREHTPPSAQIGVAEIGQLGYWAERPMVDYLGLLQPELANALARRDVYWWLPHALPDYLVLSGTEGEALYSYSLEGDLWFHSTYREIARFADPRYLRSPLVIYQRIGEARPLTEATVSPQDFDGGLTVTGLVTDFSLRPLEAGLAVRVRVSWSLSQPAETQQHLVVRLLGRQGTLAGQSDRLFDLSTWPAGALVTTYHTFILAPQLDPGVYDLAVGVGPTPEDMTWRNVAQAKVPFNDAIPPDMTPLSIPLGNQIALESYRLTQTGNTLDVALAWRALTAPPADYVMFIHVRDAEGQIVAQFDGEPHGGLYPTSVWDAGEIVLETTRVDISAVPPGQYTVYAGLYTRTGDRLTSPNGEDAIILDEIILPNATD